jgi:hypothetical protein
MSDEQPQLAREQAEQALATVREWLVAKGSWDADEVELYEPGFHCNGWAIALEGGPEEWPWHVSQDVGEEGWPDGVFAEPVNHWCLGLYVEWSNRPGHG